MSAQSIEVVGGIERSLPSENPAEKLETLPSRLSVTTSRHGALTHRGALSRQGSPQLPQRSLAVRSTPIRGRRRHPGIVRPTPRSATPIVADPIVTTPQKTFLLGCITALVMGFVLAPLGTAIAVNAALTLFFATANVFKLLLVRHSLDKPSTIEISDGELGSVRDADLPIYTILVPVYREAAVLRQLLEGIVELDYPDTKLDVKVLVELDDAETAAALAEIELPLFIEVLTIPDVGPKGKPRACNYGLTRARGEFLVIYDAEDRAEADQLRKVVMAFRKAPAVVVCLQAQLNYFNRTQNILTRWFAAEYSTWFDQLLPGLQSHDYAIPLGGTSNHLVTARLRELGGWNAFNVTEDADLGMRIFRRGWKTAMVNSTTYEEANSRPRNWIRQRSRWAKGYMQTYLCHMRHPVQLFRQMGLRAYVAFHLFFGAQTLCLLINPLFWMITAVWFGTHLHIIERVFPSAIEDVGVAGMFIGNAAFVLTTVAGCLRRRYYDDVKWAFLVPAYWLLMSIAAWKGLIQLFIKPYYWEKTTHGFSMFEQSGAAASSRRRITADGPIGGP